MEQTLVDPIQSNAPTSNHASNQLREHLLDLMKRKDGIEKEIKSLSNFLEAEKGVGMNGPLVDADGFPRNDIDVPAVRDARHQVACLNTDHKNLMTAIESRLLEWHALVAHEKNPSLPLPPSGSDSLGDSGGGSRTGRAHVERDPGTQSIVVPSGSRALSPSAARGRVPGGWGARAFLLVDSVEPDSPASSAGLQVGDRILRFGPLGAADFHELKQVGELVTHSENQELQVMVIRGEGEKLETLSLKPRTWTGRGLLGCHIVPIQRPKS